MSECTVDQFYDVEPGEMPTPSREDDPYYEIFENKESRSTNDFLTGRDENFYPVGYEVPLTSEEEEVLLAQIPNEIHKIDLKIEALLADKAKLLDLL